MFYVRRGGGFAIAPFYVQLDIRELRSPNPISSGNFVPPNREPSFPDGFVFEGTMRPLGSFCKAAEVKIYRQQVSIL